MRATYPIPAACGIYYFEVKIVSKGRDGSVHVASSTIFCLHAELDKFIRTQASVRCLYNKCVLNLHAVMVCCIPQLPNIVFYQIFQCAKRLTFQFICLIHNHQNFSLKQFLKAYFLILPLLVLITGSLVYFFQQAFF